MSSRSAGSGYLSASEVCRNPNKFEIWRYEVSAVFPPLSAVPVGLIADVVKESTRLPSWVYDKDSVEHQLFHTIYAQQMTNFSTWLRGPIAYYHGPVEESLPKSMVHALPHILYIPDRHTNLLSKQDGTSFNESDLRQPLDRLASHVWCTEVGQTGGFIFRSECTLKLPNTKTYHIADSTVDSVLLAFDPKLVNPLTTVQPDFRKGLTCTIDEVRSLQLVHWVMEYETSNFVEVQRQVYYGIVSSLWQRRALGRMDDFVFGLAHAENAVKIYAARWEKKPSNLLDKITASLAERRSGTTNSATKKSSKKVAARTALGKSTEVVLDSAPKKRQRASKLPEKTDENEAETRSSQTPSLIQHDMLNQEEKDHQIMVYEIANYTTSNPADMAQLYILMRASRNLATTYLEEISSLQWAETAERIQDLGRFAWPSLPRPRTGTRSSLGSVPEEIGLPGGQQVAYVADPMVEATWKAEWERERHSAIKQLGSESLGELDLLLQKGDAELGLDDRMLSYLGSLN